MAWLLFIVFEILQQKNYCMAGRGDKNKKSTSGRGANNQSSQAFGSSSAKHPKSGHNKKHTGGKPSEPSPKSADPGATRNEPLKDSKRKQDR